MASTRGEGVACPDYDVAIIGGGIAGLSVALRLSRQKRIALFTKGLLGESNTRYAQGGLSVALGADDSPELHYLDTIAAGAGLCDEAAVRVLVEQGPAAVRWLIEMGVQFDRVPTGSDAHATPDGLLLGREGAHSRWRVLHADGDATGAEIERALTTALCEASSVTLYEETFVQCLLVDNGVCIGLQAVDRDGQSFTLTARATVLANGGAGGLWLHTSNPAGATADGLALAWNAGAALADLEFMQFHPTVMVAEGTSHLISEAVRGEGAYLRNHAGERFMPRYSPQAELAPRDVVARAILNEMVSEHTEYQYLDLRHLPAEKMHARFPNISAVCEQQGLDLARDLLPIAPAAHYCMGGVLVDTYGRSTIPGLYAVGEVSCTGVHGANRLASNSLLEGLVYGVRVADHLNEQADMKDVYVPSQNTTTMYIDTMPKESTSSTSMDEQTIVQVRHKLRQVMWQYVSLCRERDGLLVAQRRVQELHWQLAVEAPFMGPVVGMHIVSGIDHRHGGRHKWGSYDGAAELIETINMLQVAELVIMAALERCESRGSHWRLDYQALDESLNYQRFAFQQKHFQSPQAGQEKTGSAAAPLEHKDTTAIRKDQVGMHYGLSRVREEVSCSNPH